MSLTVELLGRPYAVDLPRSFLRREDAARYWRVGGVHQGLAWGAAIALCCPDVERLARLAAEEEGRVWPSYDRFRDVAALGEATYDYLCGLGLAPAEVRDRALPILEALQAALIQAHEVAARRDFTGPTRASST